MTQKRYSEARKQIVHAYELVRQTGGDGTIVQRVAQFLGRKLDEHGDHSHIRRTIQEHRSSQRNPS